MVIFTTHRLSAVKYSDKVLMMEHGKVEDFNTHDNLMKNSKAYNELYSLQAQYYEY